MSTQPQPAGDVWMAAGDLRAVKLQLSVLFAELREESSARKKGLNRATQRALRELTS